MGIYVDERLLREVGCPYMEIRAGRTLTIYGDISGEEIYGKGDVYAWTSI